jgi:hypothetical protein
MRNEKFDELCVGKDDEVMECQVDGRVTYRSEEKLIMFCVRECSELWALVRIGLIREMLLKWTLKNSDFRVWCRIC